MNAIAFLRLLHSEGYLHPDGELTRRGEAVAEERHQGDQRDEDHRLAYDLQPYPESSLY